MIYQVTPLYFTATIFGILLLIAIMGLITTYMINEKLRKHMNHYKFKLDAANKLLKESEKKVDELLLKNAKLTDIASDVPERDALGRFTKRTNI